MKKGRLSKDEQNFISENSESLSVEQIASELDRDPKSIAKWIKDHIGVSQSDRSKKALIFYNHQVSLHHSLVFYSSRLHS